MIVGANTVNSIIRMLPPGTKEAVTLGSRQVRETGYTNVSWVTAQRKPAKNSDLLLVGATIGEEWIVFNLFKTTESTDPKLGDRITDAASVVWQVKKIGVKMMNLIFKCFCLKNK